LILVVGTTLAFAQAEDGKSPVDKEKTFTLQKLPSSLEEMLSRALEANPDICVAKADLQYAYARVKQVRLKISQALVEAFQARHVRKEALKIEKSKYENMHKLVESGHLQKESLFPQRQSLAAAEAALAETESMIRGLAGIDPVSGNTPDSLEKALSQAFQSNGEIGLTKADLIRMEAKLNQIRLKVSEEVTITFQVQRSKRNALVVAEKMFHKVQTRAEEGVLPEHEKLAAFQAVIEAEAELARVEARLRYLLGLGGVLRSSQ